MYVCLNRVWDDLIDMTWRINHEEANQSRWALKYSSKLNNTVDS